MTHRRRRAVWLLLGLLCGARLAWTRHQRWHGPWTTWQPAAATAAGHNAYDDYRAAYRALPADLRGYAHFADGPRAADELRRAAPALALVRAAVEHPCRAPRPSVLSAGCPLRGECATLGLALHLTVREAARAGRAAEAVEAQLAALRVQAAGEPSSVRCAGQCERVLPAQVDRLTAAEARAALERWRRLVGEREFASAAATWVEAVRADVARSLNVGSHDWLMLLAPSDDHYYQTWGPRERWMLRALVADHCGHGRRDAWRLLAAHAAAIDAWARAPYGTPPQPPGRPIRGFENEFLRDWRARWLVGETQRRLLGAALALQAWRAEQGHYPELLTALVPDLLPRVPVDPFDGQPLRYRLEAGRPLLYSVGPDQRDQGGAQVRFAQSAVEWDSRGDLAWAEPRFAEWGG